MMGDQGGSMDPKELFTIQAALEGLRFSGDGYLVRWKEMPGESGPPARVVAANYSQEQRVYFGDGIDREIEELIRLLPVQALLDADHTVFDLLNRQRQVAGHAIYRTYTATDTAAIQPCKQALRLCSQDERLRGFSEGFFGISYRDVFAVIIEGAVVSAAASSREDETAAELWVYSHPDYRRQGFAREAAAAWLHSVIGRGLIPFYSHVTTNEASRHLAESLPLRLCFVLSCYP